MSGAAHGPARQPQPADAFARARALDPAASFIVQAPAGSGKTSLLVQRFLVLLGEASQPESVVAITFTRKAAGEMRARVLAALEKASGDAAGENAYDQVTIDAARAALDRDREQGWDLRSNPARLRIQTIDSLCASIVQRMPWMARTGGMPRIVEDARELYRDAAVRTLTRVTGEDAAARAVETLLLHLDNDFRAVQGMLEELLPKRDQWLRHLGVNAGGPELRALLEEALAGVVARGLKRVGDRIPPVVLARIGELFNVSGRRIDPPRTPLAGVPGVAPEDLPAWRALSEFLLTGNGDWRKSVTARQGFPPHYKEEKAEFLAVLAELSADPFLLPALQELRKLPDPRFSAEQWSVLEALLVLLPVAAAELKVAFRERGAVDFVELGEAARRALGSPDHPSDLAFSLGERIQHLLIDEFQDTSVSQFELAERLVASWEAADPGAAGDRTLFLVGDPMQSIYRFREAEVGLFLRARTEGLRGVACEPLRLTANFRSRPALVDWVNATFARIFPEAEDATLGAVAYTESQASRAPALDPDAVTVHPFDSGDQEPEAEQVARLAEAALPGSTAILVRARSHATAIVAALLRRRIPFRAVEFDQLTARPAIQDLLALTRALLHLGDRTAWLAVLRAPWCGLTLSELYELSSVHPKAMIWEQFAARPVDAAGNPRLARVRSALEAALARVRQAPLRDCVESCWRSLGGPDCWAAEADQADCLRYLDLLDEVDNGGETSFGLLERRVGQLFGLPQAGDGAAVDLMTIHKAKGLEWDTVILPGLGRDAASDSKPLLRWSELPGDTGARLVFGPIEATREERDPIFSYLAHIERQREKHETARLLYVAVTRARERLHLLGHAESPAAASTLRPRSRTLLQLLWPVVEPLFPLPQPRAAVSSGTGDPETRLPLLMQSLRRLPQDWSPPPPPPALIWTQEEVEEASAAAAVTFEWAGETLRHAGTITHRWLEKMGRDGLAAWDRERVANEAPAIRAALESLGLTGDETGEAALIVSSALEQTLADPRGRWLLETGTARATELRVSIAGEPTASGRRVIQHYSIDLTFVDAAGTRWVVDFKTGSHLGAGLDEFLDTERDRYRDRMNNYARYFQAVESRPIRLALYFPLLQGWREWEPE